MVLCNPMLLTVTTSSQKTEQVFSIVLQILPNRSSTRRCKRVQVYTFLTYFMINYTSYFLIELFTLNSTFINHLKVIHEKASCLTIFNSNVKVQYKPFLGLGTRFLKNKNGGMQQNDLSIFIQKLSRKEQNRSQGHKRSI